MLISINKNSSPVRFSANVDTKKSANKLLDNISQESAKPIRSFIEDVKKNNDDLNVEIASNWLGNKFKIKMQKDEKIHTFFISPTQLIKDYDFSHKQTKKFLNILYDTGLQKLGLKKNKE